MDAPYFLQIGTLVIEDGTGTTDYKVKSMEFPEPAPDGFGGYLPAVRVVNLDVTGATAAAVSTNLNALRRAPERDEYIYRRHGTTGEVRQSKIRSASVIETVYDPCLRDQFKTNVTVTLETDPYWLAPWSATVTPTVTTVPGHFDVTPGGEVPALLRIRSCIMRGHSVHAIGVWPSPGTGFSYVDDYGDVDDANALTGHKEALSATADLTAIGTAPTFDTNDNRGRHLAIARCDSNATAAASNTVAARVTTTGNAYSGATSVTLPAVAFAELDLHGRELGVVQVPSGQVPDIDTGSGYAAESAEVSQTTAASTYECKAYYNVQSFPVAAACLHTGVSVKVTTNAAIQLVASLYAASSDVPTGSVLASQTVSVSTGTAQVIRFTWPVPINLAAGNYCVEVYVPLTSATVSLYYSTATTYAGGKLSTGPNPWPAEGSWTTSDTDDLYLISYVRAPLAFLSSMPILAACSESSKTINLDYAVRVPLDYGCIIARTAVAAGIDLFYDGDTDTPYSADEDGIGPSAIADCEIVKPLRLKPGVVNRVIIAAAQNELAVAGFDALSYSYRERYLSASG